MAEDLLPFMARSQPKSKSGGLMPVSESLEPDRWVQSTFLGCLETKCLG